MGHNAHEAYLESRILSADPIELVKLLYQGCSGAVKDARRHLAAGEIAARSRAISKAWEILRELSGALDHAHGGDISRRLASLYEYMQRRLLEANVEQTDGPLAEVLSLLFTLSEAWDGVKAAGSPAAAQPSPWAQPAAEAGAGCHAWSF